MVNPVSLETSAVLQTLGETVIVFIWKRIRKTTWTHHQRQQWREQTTNPQGDAAQTEAVVAYDRRKEFRGKDKHDTCGPDERHVSEKRDHVAADHLGTGIAGNGAGHKAANCCGQIVDDERSFISEPSNQES